MKIIKNYEKIATSKQREAALSIIKAGLLKVCPFTAMDEKILYRSDFNTVIIQNNSYDLLSGRIFVIGGGKANGQMAEALEEIIGADNITDGVVNCIDSEAKTKKIKIIKAGHPLPDKRGIKGVEKMLELKEKYKIGKKDLVICLISGGGSALMPAPVDSVSLDDNQKVTRLLMNSGADIQEINSVRKHISKIKGGQLAAHFFPAKVVSIIISDVIRNRLDTIASGPTVPDKTTFKDAYGVLSKYKLLDKVPVSIKNHILAGCEDNAQETPKELINAENYIIADSGMALGAMAYQAKTLGLKPLIASTEIIGDPATAATEIANDIVKGEYEGYDVLLCAGETTPTLPLKHGKGGRNQHFAATSILALQNYKAKWTMAAIASDGVDYVNKIAGALVDDTTLQIANSEKVDPGKYLRNYDSFTFFKKVGDCLIEAGPTGTNVGDLFVYILK